MQEHTDAELVVLARRGEAEAFVHLVERYRLIASAVALRHLPDRESVRDIVQEAILQAYLSLDHLRDPARFKSWFYAIVVNTCRTWLRGQPPRGVSLEALDPAEVGAFGPDPQEVVEEHERVEAVRAALSMLSPHVRQVMASYYDDQLSIGEIAIASASPRPPFVIGCTKGATSSDASCTGPIQRCLHQPHSTGGNQR